MKKSIRVILHPGTIRSKSDGDVHFIGSSQLANLYGVIRDLDEVHTFDPRNPTHDAEWQKDHNIPALHLYPLRSGKYNDIHQYDDMEVVRPATLRDDIKNK